MSGNRVRCEAKAFWEKIGELRTQYPRKRAPEGASCKTCQHFKVPKCTAKNKLVNHYNVCERWKGTSDESVKA